MEIVGLPKKDYWSNWIRRRYERYDSESAINFDKNREFLWSEELTIVTQSSWRVSCSKVESGQLVLDRSRASFISSPSRVVKCCPGLRN